MIDVAIVGAGFTGLAAALDLARNGYKIAVFERDPAPGGLAGSFSVNGTQPLEKFYHHWFTNDVYVNKLVGLLGCAEKVTHRETRTGMYYAGRFFKLASPMDLLRFSPLSWPNRIRLGVATLRARRVKNWEDLEGITARDWLLKICGEQAYRVVWEPLLIGKFGEYASTVSAVWFWNKLKLRGASRDKRGREVLAYYRGGFSALVDDMVAAIHRAGGQVTCNVPVNGLAVLNGKVQGIETSQGRHEAGQVVLTTALPIAADMMAPHVGPEYLASLRRVRYLANICVVLELDRSLSSLYWLNVNDPSFPFVGIIEHTNFEDAATYGGRHIVYLSKYLPANAEFYTMPDDEAVKFSVAALKRMFPQFSTEWMRGAHVWRADYAQPVVERHYGAMVPPTHTPIEGVHLATMAQIYPEDRGTNYAIRAGFEVAAQVRAAGTDGRRQPRVGPASIASEEVCSSSTSSPAGA